MNLINNLMVLIALYLHFVLGNVEKVIFKGPEALTLPRDGPSLDNLQLLAISPTNATLRTPITPIFASEEYKAGSTSWFILHNLTEGQRYELRLCWAATQPTNFKLKWFSLEDVFADPELMSTLAAYSESRQVEAEVVSNNMIPAHSSSSVSGTQSVLLLRVTAAADYYSANKTMMENVEPVLVDIILDPYVLNVFPTSLVVMSVWIVLVALASFFIAQFVSRWLRIVASLDNNKKDS